MSVSVNQITKIYGQQKALDNISFEVKPGEILGFLGPNGAGKSTTMKILTAYLPQNAGKASVCGFDVNEQAIEVRKNIGYLPELNPLYTDMYVKEYLLFAAHTQGMGKAANKAVEDMIQKTGLTQERKKHIAQLSKGYKQRVGLAAAMLHNPKVLILDEPTSGLDPNQVGDMRNLIKEIGRDKTVILSTHIMQEVEAMCSRVVIINKGKIVADDSIAKLQKNIAKEFIIWLECMQEIDKNSIQNINGVINIIATKNKYTITASHDVREQIARLMANNNWLILSMSLEEKSLEEVFQNLTN